jgi:chromosomal replication initiation ATPase DnaA
MSPKAESIIQECAAKHGVTAERVLGKSRITPVVRARQEAIYRIREELRPLAVNPDAYSYPQIGRIFYGADGSGLNHSTVISSIRAHKRRINLTG